MSHTPLIILSILVAGACAQSRFSDYDYQDNSFDQQQQQPQAPQVRAPQRGSPQRAPTTVSPPPPVAILKQINTHNDDGSYTYGYEGADGSFKIETKTVTGEVMGKYGYVDSDGKLRTVEYGANKFGFQPSGEGITVPPPTLVDERRRGPNGEIIEYEDEEQAQPQIQTRQQGPAPRPRPRPQPQQQQQQQQQQHQQQQQQQQPEYNQQPIQPQFAPRPRPRPQPQPQQQPIYQQQPYIAPTARQSGPVPPRASIPGAAFAPSAAPVPPRAQIAGAAPAAPVFESQDQFNFNVQPRRTQAPRASARGSSNLDDLAQQYALPHNAGTRPVAEFSFSDNDPAYQRTINF